MRGPGFDFNKAEHIFFPTDQVNLASPQRRAKIAGHHYISQPPQIEIHIFLAAPPRTLVTGPLFGASVCAASQSSARNVVCVMRPGSIIWMLEFWMLEFWMLGFWMPP